jgi:hypothetical protein
MTELAPPAQVALGRDLRIDMLRGILLVLITINHFGSWFPTVWWSFHFTWQPLGYMSAAEGFVIVAGYSFARTYSRYVNEPSILWRKARQRAFTLYLYHLVLMFGFASLFLWVPVYSEAWTAWLSAYATQPLHATIAAVFLVYQPPYMDILPMYALFLFFSPLVLLALHRHYAPAVLVVSLGLWGLGQILSSFDTIVAKVFSGYWVGDFNMCSWQVLYVLGLWLGVSYHQSFTFRLLQNHWLWSLAAITASVLLLSRHSLILPELATGIDRPTLGWVRLCNVLLLTGIGSLYISRLNQPRQTSWFIFLGQHSLQVFTCHIALLYALVPLLDQLAISFGGVGLLLVVIGAVFVLYLAAVLHDSYKTWKLSIRPLPVRT